MNEWLSSGHGIGKCVAGTLLLESSKAGENK